jgi:hypothetical protein
MMIISTIIIYFKQIQSIENTYMIYEQTQSRMATGTYIIGNKIWNYVKKTQQTKEYIIHA